MFSTPPSVSVPLRTDDDGTIRVSGTRVPLESLIACHQRGDKPEEIHAAFPVVPLADVYAVLAYYLVHQAEVDAYIQQGDKAADALRRDLEARHPDMFALQTKLRAAHLTQSRMQSG
jgi:uncharacterized protein (DUF433 family)